MVAKSREEGNEGYCICIEPRRAPRGGKRVSAARGILFSHRIAHRFARRTRVAVCAAAFKGAHPCDTLPQSKMSRLNWVLPAKWQKKLHCPVFRTVCSRSRVYPQCCDAVDSRPRCLTYREPHPNTLLAHQASSPGCATPTSSCVDRRSPTLIRPTRTKPGCRWSARPPAHRSL